MARYPLKTSHPTKFFNNLRNQAVWYPKLYQENLECKFRARSDFFLGGRKKSVLDNTLNQFLCPGESPDDLHVAYGNGNVAATSRNELSVPTKKVKKETGRKYRNTNSTDEYMTSSTCIECGAQLFPVYHVYMGLVYGVRGLKFCNSPDCSNCCLKHRENVGALNIYKMFLFEVYGVPLPVLLIRNHPSQALKLNTKQLVNQHHLTSPKTSVGKSRKIDIRKKIRYEKRKRQRARKAEQQGGN